MANAVEQVRPFIEANEHRMILDLQPGAAVSGDDKRLVQVLTNLLNNAAKYTPRGGHINLSVAVDLEKVRIRVKDDGIGIAKEAQPLIFELFAQAERAPDRSERGWASVWRWSEAWSSCITVPRWMDMKWCGG